MTDPIVYFILTFLLLHFAVTAPNSVSPRSTISAADPRITTLNTNPTADSCSLQFPPSVFLPSQNDSEISSNLDSPVQWPITSTLYLDLSPGGASLDSEAVTCLLKDANKVAGKKSSGTLLNEKWGLRNGGFWRGVEFNIAPEKIKGQSHLTWEDVANAINGLTEWYKKEGNFVFVYFLIEDIYKGQLGKGSLKRPWHDTPPIVTGPGGPANGGSVNILKRGTAGNEDTSGHVTLNAHDPNIPFRTAGKA